MHILVQVADSMLNKRIAKRSTFVTNTLAEMVGLSMAMTRVGCIVRIEDQIKGL